MRTGLNLMVDRNYVFKTRYIPAGVVSGVKLLDWPLSFSVKIVQISLRANILNF
jgi:hypothetical protein